MKKNLTLILVLIVLIGLCFFTYSTKVQNLYEVPNYQGVVSVGNKKSTLSSLEIINRSNAINKSDETIEGNGYTSIENKQYIDNRIDSTGNGYFENSSVIDTNKNTYDNSNNNNASNNSNENINNNGTTYNVNENINSTNNIDNNTDNDDNYYPQITSNPNQTVVPTITTKPTPSPSISIIKPTPTITTRPTPSPSISIIKPTPTITTRPTPSPSVTSKPVPSPSSYNDTILDYSYTYGVAGRVYLPTIGHSVTIYYANVYDDGHGSYNAQEIIDRVDSAAYYQIGAKDIIADHNYQGFSKIINLKIGDIAYIEKSDGTRKYYSLKRKLIGLNTVYDLTDKAGNSIDTMSGSLAMYTCYIEDGEIILTLWDEV